LFSWNGIVARVLGAWAALYTPIICYLSHEAELVPLEPLFFSDQVHEPLLERPVLARVVRGALQKDDALDLVVYGLALAAVVVNGGPLVVRAKQLGRRPVVPKRTCARKSGS
jgi:hypothetical protein